MTDQQRESGKPDNRRKEDGGKFNYFWVYAILILFLFLSLNMSFFGTNKTEISKAQLQSMMEKGDVEKLVVINEDHAEVFLKETALSRPDYQKIAKSRFGTTNRGPHYFLSVASKESFENFVNGFYEKHPQLAQVELKFERQEDWFFQLVGYLLPVILLIGFWVYMMRRAGGGAVGGGGIFNI